MNIARQVIKVDPDFAAIWGNLDGEAYQGLKAEIQQDGIRDPLVIWNPSNNYILVDGHNRLRIAEELHMNSVPVSYKVFKDKTEAAEWIVSHQSSRRNISDWQKFKAVEAYQKILREKAKEQQIRKPQSVLENSPKQKPIDVRKETAKTANLSEWKVRQGDYIQKNATEEQKAALDSGQKTMKEVYNETFRATFPTKANRLKQAQEAVEATKQEGATIDLQKAKAHKQAEKILNNELAYETSTAIYNIVRESRKLTPENIENYKAVYSQKDRKQTLMNARSLWDAGQLLSSIARWIQEVNK